ncbi:hypothetical protein SMIDD22_01801 [Streptococcus mitis]|uniref:Uncharacterized protein n=1 Tax=Streptococcus mitis TaxID=28037 RepID=A0A139R7Z0_STRMT|nr:hypothetical protein SMIDD22_01801 [Streptococcus mitis]
MRLFQCNYIPQPLLIQQGSLTSGQEKIFTLKQMSQTS